MILKNNYIVGLGGYPQDLTGVMNINNYIVESRGKQKLQ